MNLLTFRLMLDALSDGLKIIPTSDTQYLPLVSFASKEECEKQDSIPLSASMSSLSEAHLTFAAYEVSPQTI